MILLKGSSRWPELQRVFSNYANEIKGLLKNDSNRITFIDFAYQTRTNNKKQKTISLLINPNSDDEFGDLFLNNYKNKIKELTSTSTGVFKSTIGTTTRNKHKVEECQKIVQDIDENRDIEFLDKKISQNDVDIEEFLVDEKKFIEVPFHNWFKICKNSNTGFGNYCTIVGVKTEYNSYYLYLYTVKEVNTSSIKELSTLNTVLGMSVSKLIDFVVNDDLRNTSLKSSLAAVMSRNMSHNIGSHVLNKLSSAAAINNFFSLEGSKRFVRAIITKEYNICLNKSNNENEELALTDDNDFKFSETTLSKEEQSKLTYVTFSLNEKGNSAFKPIYTLSPYFVDVNNNSTKEELARVFNDYLKKRMDFVADVATSNKALLNSNKYLFADIFRGFERNLLLLHNISGKEDKFSYQFDFQYCDGENTYHYYEKDESNQIILDKDGCPIKNNSFIDPIVAVPNDVLGSQAFYIILENIIRNTAKHSGSGNVIFTIKVEDLKEDDFYRITVFDDVSFNSDKDDIEKYKGKIKGYEKLNEEEQKNAIKAYKLKKLVVDRNVSIAQDVLDKNNQIRTAGWGTIEIKLAACYLSGLDMLEMDNKIYWPIGYPKYDEIRNENDDRDSDEAKAEAKESYIEFLRDKKSEEFTIDVEGLKKALEVTDCAKNLTRTIDKEKKDNNEVVRYPIVQAVDGNEKDKTSGFGYSFLMKKPKKLLIIDENEHLKLDIKDDNGKIVTSHKDNVIALKRLGIEIIKAPNRDSIYNHQFMIIVGDGQIKEITLDENGNKRIPFYGDWFNLPQERCLYHLDNRYIKFVYDKIQNLYEINSEYISSNFIEDLLKISSIYKEKKILDFKSLYQLFSKLNNKFYVANKKKTFSAKIIIETYDKGEFSLLRNTQERTFEEAAFGHHGMPPYKFKNNKYAEPYGSTSPIGLHLESIKSELSNNKDSDHKLIKLRELQYFYEEGCNTRVFVLDERIQSVLNDKGFYCEAGVDKANGKEYKGYSITYRQLFKKTNINVPKADEINLNDPKIELERLEKYLASKAKKIDYLVIHFGIIENLRTDELKDLDLILRKIEKSIKSSYCKTIITSGRGYTPDIRDLNRYFIAYSTISNLLLDPNSRSKSSLISCLKQARKQKI